MGQEFTIKSQAIEDKVNQLLPSQGGFQAGVDFSASTMVVPIVDLTETAEGSSVRADLQTAFSHNGITSFSINNTTNSVILNTTGYYKVLYSYNPQGLGNGNINLFDGTTAKNVVALLSAAASAPINGELGLFLSAGDSLRVTASANVTINGSLRQIADINGNLVQPT